MCTWTTGSFTQPAFDKVPNAGDEVDVEIKLAGSVLYLTLHTYALYVGLMLRLYDLQLQLFLGLDLLGEQFDERVNEERSAAEDGNDDKKHIGAAYDEGSLPYRHVLRKDVDKGYRTEGEERQHAKDKREDEQE